MKPAIMLPIPCALSSRFVGVIRFKESCLSDASTHNSVSKLATTAITRAVLYTSGFAKAEKSGSEKLSSILTMLPVV